YDMAQVYLDRVLAAVPAESGQADAETMRMWVRAGLNRADIDVGRLDLEEGITRLESILEVLGDKKAQLEPRQRALLRVQTLWWLGFSEMSIRPMAAEEHLRTARALLLRFS